MYDLAKVPFSRYGSYWSITDIEWGKVGKGVYLHVLAAKTPQVFKIDPVRGGETVGFDVVTSPASLVLKPEGGGEIEFIIDADDAVRVRGSDVALRLEMPKERWHHTHPLPGNAWCFSMNPHNVQIVLDPSHGEISVDAPWRQGKGFCYESEHMIATVSPDADGTFEMAIDEILTTWVRPERKDFDLCLRNVKEEYAAWTENLPSAPSEYETTRDLAAYVNWSAVVNPAGYIKRPTMLMSKIGMCNVYNWDNVFNAMAHCRHQPDLAWDQLVMFCDYQDEFGKPPSNFNRNRMGSTITNAPVHGWGLRRMWDANPDMMTPERMEEAYDFLSKWTDWHTNHRTWPGDNLPFYQHGFDCGWDNTSLFDDGVPVVTPDLATYLILQMETLVDLANSLERPDEAASWQGRRDAMLDALLNDLWKEDHFVGIVRPSGKIVDCDSLIICMPIILGKRLPEDVRSHLVARLHEHLHPYGLATEKVDSPKYIEGGYWRGPFWAPVTMIAVCGLLEIGEEELAGKIVKGFCEACRENGFYENFDPITGKGYYDTAYTWTSSVFMIFVEQLRNECA